jgi:hypothetical protein
MFLADSQWHWSMEGRDLVREANLSEYQENPAFVKEIGLEAESPGRPRPGGRPDDPGRARDQIPRGNSLYVTRSSTACTSGG